MAGDVSPIQHKKGASVGQPPILAVTGSPRVHGNCAVLVEEFRRGAERCGVGVDVVRLHDLCIRPCSACRKCKDSDAADCAIDDDMRQLYPKMRAAPALLIASPIYWWNLAAQTKLFIDRCDALDGPSGSALTKKKVGALIVYGGEDAIASGAVNAIRSLQDAFQYLHMEVVGIVHGSAWEAAAVRLDERLMGKALDLGRDMAQRVLSSQ
jgi:multimeric flavodoxin WrbA